MLLMLAYRGLGRIGLGAWFGWNMTGNDWNWKDESIGRYHGVGYQA